MEKQQLSHSLNLVQLMFYGIGSMVGAGIYSVIGVAAGEAGTGLWISFVLAGIAAFFTVLSYAELSSMLPKAGAEYQFLKTAFPQWKLFSFMAGYLIALNAAATSATVSLAFAGYLNVFTQTPHFATAFALLAFCTAVNIAGIRQSTWVSMALICIEIAGLLLMVWSGVESGQMGKAFEEREDWGNVAGIFSATALIFFIYIGFEDVANLSEETKDPTKNVPRALIFSSLLTSALYILVAFSVIALASPEMLAESASPLSDAAGSVVPWRGQALGVAALFATASTALISLISISRMLFGMARDGDMPAPLARTSGACRAPWVAALVLFGAACLFLPLGEIKIIASVSSFGVLLVFTGVQAAVIALRFRMPEQDRPFRIPFTAGKVPLVPAIGICLTLALLTQFEPVVYLVGAAAVALGIVVYTFYKKK